MHRAARTGYLAPQSALTGAAAVAAAALLVACAAPPPPAGYGPVTAAGVPAAPASGPTARLLVRSDVPAGDRYALYLHADPIACQGARQITSGTAGQAPGPVNIPAGRLALVDFVILRGDKPTCGVRWSFSPQPGKTYVVNGLPVGSSCTARLLDATVPERAAAPPDLLVRNAPGQACMSLARAREVAAANAANNPGSLIQGGQSRGEAVLNPRATAADLQGLINP